MSIGIMNRILKPGETYLLAELDQLSKALDQTYTFLTKTYQFYLIISAIPFSALALLDATKLANMTLNSIPTYVAWLFTFIGLLGFLVSWEIHCIHMRQIHYARAINGIRAYFKDRYVNISNYLVLPSDKTKPDFDWAKISGRQFALVFRISLMTSIMFYVGTINTQTSLTQYWPCSSTAGAFILSALLFILNFLIRYLIAGKEAKAKSSSLTLKEVN